MTGYHTFCRVLLWQTMQDVRRCYTPDEIKRAWAWRCGKDFEFHGPNGEYLHNLRMTDCKWSALAEGWQQLMEIKDKSVG
jgi:hypothetical protein